MSATDLNEITVVQRHVRIGDPHVTSDNADRLSILSNVYQALVNRSADGAFKPALAHSWRAVDHASRWVFDIRDDVHFSDGKQLEPRDVVASMERVRDEPLTGELGTTGVIAGYLADATFDISSSGQVEVVTPAPFADLLDLLVDLPILSEHDIGKRSGADFVGTGPYQIADQSADTVVLRTRAGPAHAGHGRRQITWRAIADDAERVASLRAGSADLATGIPPSLAASVRRQDQSTIKLVASPTTVCATFMFNLLRDSAPSRAVRRAVNWAVDVDALNNDVMFGTAKPLTGPMTPLHLGFDPDTRGFGYDPDRARRELDTDPGFGGHLRLDVPDTLPDEAIDLANRISGYLDAIGIRVEIVVHKDRPAYAESVKNKQIGDAACFDSSPASTYRLLREKFDSRLAGPWWLGYRNTEVDAAIDLGARTADVSARRAIYRRAYNLISEDAAWLFLYNPARITGIRVESGLNQEQPDWSPRLGGLITFD